MQHRDEIKFYENGQPYDFFSNVSDIGIKFWFDGRFYNSRSTEAVYQGVQGYLPEVDEYGNRLATSTRPAAMNLMSDPSQPGGFIQGIGKQFKSNLPDYFHKPMDWELLSYFDLDEDNSEHLALTLKEQFMYELLLIKATQNIEVLKALIETGDKEIIENTQLQQQYNDDFWGNGQDGNGRNALGKAWMRVRETLQKELNDNDKIKVRSGFNEMLVSYMFDLNDDERNKNPNDKYPRYISRNDLDNTPLLTTVDEIRRHRAQSSSKQTLFRRSPVSSNPFEGKDSPTHFIKKQLNAQGIGVLNVYLSPDKNDTSKGVLKFEFGSANDAKKFASALKIPVVQAGSFIIMSLEGKKQGQQLQQPKAEQVLESLGIGKYGRSNPQRIIKVLEEQWDSQKSQTTSHQPRRR